MYVLMAKCYFPMKSAILIMPLFSTVVLESNSPLTRGQAASVGSIKFSSRKFPQSNNIQELDKASRRKCNSYPMH